jgi:nucleotide-binding universal stress UspA family protein
MKTILVPTDFSDHALYALKVAASIAKIIKARIRIIHASNIPSIGVKESAYYENFNKELKLKAETELEKLTKLDFLKNVRIDKYLISDRLIYQLVKNEKFRKAELIVIGSHGRSGFNRLLIGSNTEKIIRMADPPVLTIKNDISDFKLGKVVFASDFTTGSNAVYDRIKFMIKSYKSQLFLLKVITPSDFESTPVSYQLMNSFKAQYSLKKCSVNIYNHINVEQGIIEFCRQIDADMVIIPTHGRTGFAHLINGSLAENIAVHEPKPVLSVKIPVVIEMKPEAEVVRESVYEHLEYF